jgi:hypothetical protein
MIFLLLTLQNGEGEKRSLATGALPAKHPSSRSYKGESQVLPTNGEENYLFRFFRTLYTRTRHRQLAG